VIHHDPARTPALRAILAVSGGLVPIGQEWARVLGWGPGELTGATFIERVHPDDQEVVINSIHAAYASGAPATFASRYAHKDGTYLRLTWEAAPRPGRVELDLVGRPGE
jgi:PAS domain-containing protein